MRWNEIFEAPIDMHQMDYPNTDGRPDSWRKEDRHLLDTGKHVERTKKLWATSVVDVIIYFVNIGWEPDKALDLALYGHDLHGENGQAGDLWELDIKPVEDKITIIYTNNEGARRIPMTGWMMAHRMFHTFENLRDGRYHGGSNVDDIKKQMSRIHEQYFAVMADIRSTYNPSLGFIDFAHTMGTTRACRDGNLSQAVELLPEMLAQYILKGQVKFNELPQQIKSVNEQTYSCTQGNYSFVNGEVQSFENWLNQEYHVLIEMCKGRIFAI